MILRRMVLLAVMLSLVIPSSFSYASDTRIELDVPEGINLRILGFDEVMKYRIVRIITREFNENLGVYRSIDLRTGFLLPKGYILTAAHSLKGKIDKDDTRISIYFYNQADTTSYITAEVVEFFPKYDLAVLKIGEEHIPEPLKEIYFSEFNLKPLVGESVQMIGNSSSKYWEYSEGNMLELLRLVTLEKAKVTLIVNNSDLESEPGFSGSPVFDSKGRIVGLHVSSNEERAISSSIPARAIVKALGEIGINDLIIYE